MDDTAVSALSAVALVAGARASMIAAQVSIATGTAEQSCLKPSPAELGGRGGWQALSQKGR
eukprot:3313751-Prymnesium_polylepis.2